MIRIKTQTINRYLNQTSKHDELSRYNQAAFFILFTKTGRLIIIIIVNKNTLDSIDLEG